MHWKPRNYPHQVIVSGRMNALWRLNGRTEDEIQVQTALII